MTIDGYGRRGGRDESGNAAGLLDDLHLEGLDRGPVPPVRDARPAPPGYARDLIAVKIPPRATGSGRLPDYYQHAAALAGAG